MYDSVEPPLKLEIVYILTVDMIGHLENANFLMSLRDGFFIVTFGSLMWLVRDTL